MSVVLRRGQRFGALVVAALLSPVAIASLAGASDAAATVTVAADGSGNYRTIQAAIAAARPGATINIKPGRYTGQVVIPSSKPGLSLIGTTGTATDVVITGNVPQSRAGASGSATVLNRAANTTIRNLTMANTYGTGSQALALYAAGDRQFYRNVRLLGHQDTFLSWKGSGVKTLRQYIYKSYIEGDVDFIYGNGTVVIDRTTIMSLDRGSRSNNGYITAAGTSSADPYGILITRSTLTGRAAGQTVALGRCWHPGGSAGASGQVVIRDSRLGGHIRQSRAWQDMSGFSWKTCRFGEYNNSGTGATRGTGDRPQLTSSEAADHTPQKYLAGPDGWNPVP